MKGYMLQMRDSVRKKLVAGATFKRLWLSHAQ